MAHHVSAPHPAPPSGPGIDDDRSHPRVLEPVLLVVLVVLAAVGAVIGIDLVSKLGISANTSVVGALVAMLIGRIPLGFLRRMRSVHRQNLAQSAISAATFASANALLTSVAVPYVFGRKDLVWPMLAGAFIGLIVDAWVLYRAFGSRLLPADAAWPPGTAAAETIKAGDRGGRRALVLAGGTAVGLAGTLFGLPLSAAGVAFLGNVWALMMFGIGLMLRQYSPDVLHTDLGAGYIPHGVMVGAGIVALGQAIHLLIGRRERKRQAAAEETRTAAVLADPSVAYTVDEHALRLSLIRGYALFTAGAVVLAVLGGLIGEGAPCPPTPPSPTATAAWSAPTTPSTCRSTTTPPTAPPSACSPAKWSPRAGSTRTCPACSGSRAAPAAEPSAPTRRAPGCAAPSPTTASFCWTSAAPAAPPPPTGSPSPVSEPTPRSPPDTSRTSAPTRSSATPNWRRHLQGDRPWSVLGQSFGGFSTLTYLGLAPEGLAQAYITGGLPTLTGHADDVYRAAYARTLAHNERYFARYPGDQPLADAVAAHLEAEDVRMPTGERLTVRRFQTLGITFGTSAKFDSLHYLLETAFTEGAHGPELTDTFLRGVDAAVSFAERPLYAALHEPIYAQGGRPTNWSAHRVREEFPAFDATAGGPLRFTGEMVYPWQFEEDPALVPLRGAAEALAARTQWPALYDLDRLAANEVPVVAAVYSDDMYVDREQALATADAVRGLRTWVTDAYAHDGVRADAAVLDRLITMAHGQGVPSGPGRIRPRGYASPA
ncbi:OPT/YSL family transporter [Streptomyces sp. JV185]|uniref:hypothetical protein n=1 Tax=Streptomyces sp. JV185 TaxID=858638 RepID=UPI002E775DA7|nr:hypothetical protein [Streptomyces sp. JV185]MEE1772566.1 OPT/YSL family transporter [Streptomyces sp. JV185]